MSLKNEIHQEFVTTPVNASFGTMDATRVSTMINQGAQGFGMLYSLQQVKSNNIPVNDCLWFTVINSERAEHFAEIEINKSLRETICDLKGKELKAEEEITKEVKITKAALANEKNEAKQRIAKVTKIMETQDAEIEKPNY